MALGLRHPDSDELWRGPFSSGCRSERNSPGAVRDGGFCVLGEFRRSEYGVLGILLGVIDRIGKGEMDGGS